MNDPPAFNTSEPSYLIEASTSGSLNAIALTSSKVIRPIRRRSVRRRENTSLQLIPAGREHRREAFLDERAVAASGFGPRQPGDPRELAGDGQAGAAEEAARDFLHCDVALHAPGQPIRKARHAERPDIGELRLVIDTLGNDQHRRLQLVERA